MTRIVRPSLAASWIDRPAVRNAPALNATVVTPARSGE